MHKPLEITTKITENGHTFTLKEKSVEFSMTTNTDSSGNSGAFIIMKLQNGDKIVVNQLKNTLRVNDATVQLKTKESTTDFFKRISGSEAKRNTNK